MARSMRIRVPNGNLTNSLWQPLKTIGKLNVSDVPSRGKHASRGRIQAPLTNYWESQKTVRKTSLSNGAHELFTSNRQDQEDKPLKVIENS